MTRLEHNVGKVFEPDIEGSVIVLEPFHEAEEAASEQFREVEETGPKEWHQGTDSEVRVSHSDGFKTPFSEVYFVLSRDGGVSVKARGPEEKFHQGFLGSIKDLQTVLDAIIERAKEQNIPLTDSNRMERLGLVKKPLIPSQS